MYDVNTLVVLIEALILWGVTNYITFLIFLIYFILLILNIIINTKN